ncbi:hypothetical protein Tco_1296272 [Tanacetum coccineum]
MEKLRNDAMEWELKAKKRVLTDREMESWLEPRKQWEEKEKEKGYGNMLRQKSRISWDIEGNENSKFFHAHVRRRNNKCNIRGLMVNGVWCEDPTTIKKEMARY